MSKIGILHIDASRLKSGGGILHLQKMLKHQAYSEFRFIYVHTYPENPFEEFRGDHIKVITYSMLSRSILHQLYWQKYIFPKVVSKNSVVFTIDSTSLARVENNVVLNQDITGFQNLSLKHFSGLARLAAYLKYKIATIAMKEAESVILTTNYAYNIVSTKIGRLTNHKVIPHGIGKLNVAMKSDYSISGESLKLIYVSPILGYKNHQALLYALRIVNIGMPVQVDFYGGGDERIISKLKKLASEDKMNRINFNGFTKRNEVIEAVRNADIAIFLSSIECFGITVLEYMRLGMPIICSNQSSMPETIKDGGVLVDPTDSMEIANAIENLASDSDQRELLGKRALEYSYQYSWEECTCQTYNHLNDVKKLIQNGR